MIAAFDLPAIGRSPSRFDFVKLENMNGHFMRATPDDELMAISIDALPYLPGGPEIAAALDDAKRAQLLAALPGLKERAKTLVELVDGAKFLFARRPLAIDEKAEEILARGGRLPSRGAAAAPRRRSRTGARRRIEAAVRDYADDQGAKLGIDRPAAARGGDRPLDLARHFRRAGGARPRREPRPHRRPGQERLTRRRRRAPVVVLSHRPGMASGPARPRIRARKSARAGHFSFANPAAAVVPHADARRSTCPPRPIPRAPTEPIRCR